MEVRFAKNIEWLHEWWHGCRVVEEGQNGPAMARTKPPETGDVNEDWVEYRIAGVEPLECVKEAVLADNVLTGMVYRSTSADPVKQFVLGKG